MGKLSGAERSQKAAERLTESRAQLAAIQARMAQSQSALDALSRLEQSAQQGVAQAQRAVDEAAQRVIDLHAQVLVAVGSDDEAQLTAEHGAAVDARKAARQQLDEARANLEQTRAKVAAESAPIKQQIEDDDDTRQDVQRLIKSLEMAQRKAHHDAGIERQAAAREHHQALQARKAEHQQAAADLQADEDAHHDEMAAIAAAHPELAGVREHAEAYDDRRVVHEVCGAYLAYLNQLVRWHTHPHGKAQRFNAGVLAQMLSNPHLSEHNTLQSILSQHQSANGSAVGLVMAAQREIREKLALLDAQRTRELAALPSVAPAE